MTVRGITASTGPGVQAGRIFTPRHIALGLMGAGLLSLGACAAPRSAPSGIPETAAAPRAPAAAVRTGRVVPAPSTPARYTLTTDAVVRTEADTLRRTDTLRSTTLLRAGVQGTAFDLLVESHTVDDGSAAPRRLAESLRAVAQFTDSAGWGFAGPREDPCLSAARAVLETTRDLWVRWPSPLRAGATWSDTTHTTLCRDGIPLRATLVRAYALPVLPADTLAPFVITRSTQVVLAGRGSLRNDPTDITGEGHSSGQLFVNARSGWIDSVRSSGQLTLEARGTTRTQRVVQESQTVIRRAPDTP